MNLSKFLKQNNIKDEQSLFNYLNDNKYDWWYLSTESKKEKEKDIYSKLWTLKDIKGIIKDKMAICWDYANLEKNIFNYLQLKSNIYQIVFDGDIETNQSHCFTVIERNWEFILFEYSFRRNAGVYIKKNIDEIIEMILDWIYLKLDYMRDKNIAVYRFKDTFPKNIDTKWLLEFAKSQEVIYEKSAENR